MTEYEIGFLLWGIVIGLLLRNVSRVKIVTHDHNADPGKVIEEK